MTDPLALPLRDIHFPPPPPWWPPAPGWWAIALLALAGAGTVLWWRRRRTRISALSQARCELQSLREASPAKEARDVIREMSALLRRLAISSYPRQSSASLIGEAWLAFLDQPLLPEHPFSHGAGRILLDGPYRPEVDQAQLEPLFDLCAEWMAALAGRSRGKEK